MKKYIKIITLSIILTVIMWLSASIILRLFANKLLFLPAESQTFDYNGIGKTYQTINLHNKKGDTIEGLLVPNKHSKKVLIYFTGNTTRDAHVISVASNYFNVFSPAYPGYHKSTGEPNNDNVCEVADLSINYLLESGFKLSDIIILGHSLGGSVAIYAGSKFNVSEVIVVNTFDNLYSMCYDKYGIFCIFGKDLFNSTADAPKIMTKFYQFHNEKDETIPFYKGTNLFEKIGSREKYFYTIDGDHAHFDIDYIVSKITKH